MILTEEHRIKRCKNRELYQMIDDYCYHSKNLYNSVNYLIKQSSRISRKLKDGEILDSYEKALIHRLNCAINAYNKSRRSNKSVSVRYIDEKNGNIVDAYFLSWYLKTSDEYKRMPYATCAQICIQEVCRGWKSFYRAVKSYTKEPDRFFGYPKPPGYLDSMKGRYQLVITSQNFSMNERNQITMPGFLERIRIRAKHHAVRQIRIQTKKEYISVQLMYEDEESSRQGGKNVMGIDLGVNNLMAVVTTGKGSPVLIDGKVLKSINQYYNKERARLQELAKRANQKDVTKRIERLTEKRNQKVRDYLHKASRTIIRYALEQDAGTIIIGNNRGWKQEVEMGKRTNQTFVSIPYKTLIDMIIYKAKLVGIQVMIVSEQYTSGTSYLDRENPDKLHYDRKRRIYRGLFVSNDGEKINADVNAAYQIIKVAGYKVSIKTREEVRRINVA